MKKLFLLSLLVVLSTSACSLGFTKKEDVKKDLSIDEAKAKAVEFINGYLVNKGQEVSIKEVVEESGLYKITVNLSNGEETVSYISKDGGIFYPSGMNIEEFKKQSDENKAAQGDTPADKPEADLSEIEKKDKPKVEIFVMSHCPYGTQMEKGLLPVVKALGNSIDFQVKFNDYAMHGEKELKEQINQYCIQKESPEKLQNYLGCFLADDSKGAECLGKSGVNKAKFDTCVKDTDSQYKITEKFKDKSTWKSGRYPSFPIFEKENTDYGVTGSPSLVVNGKKVEAGRDSATLLKTICAGFNKEPEACKTELSSETPAPGFGFGGTGSGSEASCE